MHALSCRRENRTTVLALFPPLSSASDGTPRGIQTVGAVVVADVAGCLVGLIVGASIGLAVGDSVMRLAEFVAVGLTLGLGDEVSPPSMAGLTVGESVGVAMAPVTGADVGMSVGPAVVGLPVEPGLANTQAGP